MAARRFWTAGLLLATLGSGVPIRAQTTTTTDSTQSRPTLFEPTDLYWAAGFAAATALMAPLDRVLAHTSQHPQLQANRILNKTAVGARLLGSPGAEVLGTTVWATGRVVGNQHLARVGL